MKFFGSDGIRFLVDSNEYFKIVEGVSNALYNLKVKEIYIGYDTRESSPLIYHLLASKLLGLGINVIFEGVISSCAMRYYSKVKKCYAINITASHNSYNYNGFKFFNNGEKLSYEEMVEFEKLMLVKPNNYEIGKFITNRNIYSMYLDYLKKLMVNNNLMISYDFANGALSEIGYELFKDDVNAELLNYEYDGKNINYKCGSTCILNSIDFKGEYLFSFDGDGDRLLIRDKLNVYDGNDILLLLANYYQEKKVVVDSNTNKAYLKYYAKKGVKVFISEVGDSNVLNLMRKKECMIGAESSGHIINLKCLSIGDGLVNALKIIKILNEGYKLKKIKLYPAKLINKEYLDLDKIKLIKNKYAKDAIINYRKSGSENLCRIYVETKSANKLKKIEEEIKNC